MKIYIKVNCQLKNDVQSFLCNNLDLDNISYQVIKLTGNRCTIEINFINPKALKKIKSIINSLKSDNFRTQFKIKVQLI